MIYRVYGPIAAEPLLHLALQHVARTPTARLSIVYEISARRPCGPPERIAEEVRVSRSKPLSSAEVANFLAMRSVHGPFALPRNPGNELYLDSILAGGVNGQQLPLSVCRCREAYLPSALLGATTDILV